MASLGVRSRRRVTQTRWPGLKNINIRVSDSSNTAFTIVELLVVIGVIGLLSGLLFSVLGRAKATSGRATCANNLKQINLAISLYAADHGGVFPNSDTNSPFSFVSTSTNYTIGDQTGTEKVLGFTGIGSVYRELVKSYLALPGPSSPKDKVFVCPLDRGSPIETGPDYLDPFDHFTSYTFNGLSNTTNAASDGIQGRPISSIQHPAGTSLVMENAAWVGNSWHQSQTKGTVIDLSMDHSKPSLYLLYNNAMDEMSFVDGHVAFIKIYNNGKFLSRFYDPPSGYDYQWKGD